MNILYICNGNVARSQEAEIFTNALAHGIHHARSAGVEPRIGQPIDPPVVEVMREVSFDMNGAFRKPVNKDIVNDADIIISFKPIHELPDFINPLPNLRYWDVADPRGQSIEFHHQVRDTIRSKAKALLAEIETQHGTTNSPSDR